MHVVQAEREPWPNSGLKVPIGHGVSVGLFEAASQTWPASHSPEHVYSDRIISEPYVPAGHSCGVAEPCGHQ